MSASVWFNLSIKIINQSINQSKQHTDKFDYFVQSVLRWFSYFVFASVVVLFHAINYD